MSLVGPTKLKACKSFLFTEGSLKVEDKEHLYILLKQIIYYVQIQTLDNQLPVILLAIRLRSLDLKHPIPGNRPPEIQG